VEDFRQDGEEATLRLCEKGNKRRTIGLYYAAAQAIQEYVHRAGFSSDRCSDRSCIRTPKNSAKPL
jgi:site-specific recombinase XerD